jgi:hypothetical protein
MSNEYSFTDHKNNRVHKGDRVKVFRTPKGQENWIGCTGVVSSIVLPGGDNLVLLFSLRNTPQNYTDRMVYHPHQYLEKD